MTSTEITKKVIARMDWHIGDIENQGMKSIGKIEPCWNCYENNKSQIPKGAIINSYNYLWNNLECVKWHTKGMRTLILTWECKVCDKKRIDEITYRNTSKRRPLKDIRSVISAWINTTENAIKEQIEYLKSGPLYELGEEYREDNDMLIAEWKGKIKGYKEVLKLLQTKTT